MTWLARDPLLILETALDQQKTSLLAGRFDNLNDIDSLLQSALVTLSSARLDPAGFQRLQQIVRRAKHQGSLLGAALRGVQDAKSARRGARQFTSYNAFGQSGQVGAAQPRFEKRS